MAANKADQKQQQASKPTLPALPKFHALDTDSQEQQDAPAAPQYNLMSKLQSVLEADDDEEETGFEDLQASNYEHRAAAAAACMVVGAQTALS